MPVETTHSQYDANLAVWRKCRDVLAGQEKVHKAGETYLPRPTGYTDDEFTAYKQRAAFYNASQRTHDGMTGLLFSKAPAIDVPDSFKERLRSVDQMGKTLEAFMQHGADEVMATGRFGILVDYPRNDSEEPATIAQVQAAGMRAYLAGYSAEDIVNWRVGKVGSGVGFTLVVLAEVEEQPVDEFASECVNIRRVLDLDNGVYRQRVFVEVKSKTKTEWELREEVTPLVGGKPAQEIPFFMISPNGKLDEVSKPPLLDLINMNLSHYMTTADLEWGAHFTGLPTAVFTGVDEKTSVKLGSSSAVILPATDATASYLEYQGQGLTQLQNILKDKKQDMASLGARMLADEKAQAEAAEAHSIKRQGENSALADLAQKISDAFTKAVRWMAAWDGVTATDDIWVILNKDYLPKGANPQMLMALLAQWQGGAIAHVDYVDSMKRLDMLDSERTSEDILAENEVSGMTMAGSTANGTQ